MKTIFFGDGYSPICNDCLHAFLEANDYNWYYVDKICQYFDIPFVPTKFEEFHNMNSKPFPIYAQFFFEDEYEDLGWKEYHAEFKRLKDEKVIEEELPEMRERRIGELQQRWGPNYDLEALNYLENLYQGLCATQNVSSALQIDQALKVCKLSYEIDNRIRSGQDFDKILASYDKIVKTADFTPKAIKNASEFDSLGELLRWLEKRGWRAKYYDDVKRDVVDESMQNIQAWNQRLYTEESSIGDEITRRIEALKTAQQLEQGNLYSEEEYSFDDLDKYQNEGFDKLFADDNFLEDIDNG